MCLPLSLKHEAIGQDGLDRPTGLLVTEPQALECGVARILDPSRGHLGRDKDRGEVQSVQGTGLNGSGRRLGARGRRRLALGSKQWPLGDPGIGLLAFRQGWRGRQPRRRIRARRRTLGGPRRHHRRQRSRPIPPLHEQYASQGEAHREQRGLDQVFPPKANPKTSRRMVNSPISMAGGRRTGPADAGASGRAEERIETCSTNRNGRASSSW